MSLLRFEHVSLRYPDGHREIVVLDDVSLEISGSEVFGVWGQRRSGKSTLLRVAAGIELPHSGRVLFDGKDVTAMSQGERAKLLRRGGIGLCSGDWRPQRNMPVVEHVALPLLSDAIGMRTARERALKALERVELANCAYGLVQRLSRGERLRLALAQALVHEPRLLLVDEPAVLLRPSEAAEVFALLRELGEDPRLALVIASEDVAALRGARRKASIDGGRVRVAEEKGTLLAFPNVRGRR